VLPITPDGILGHSGWLKHLQGHFSGQSGCFFWSHSGYIIPSRAGDNFVSFIIIKTLLLFILNSTGKEKAFTSFFFLWIHSKLLEKHISFYNAGTNIYTSYENS